jgi:hypothetical protein
MTRSLPRRRAAVPPGPRWLPTAGPTERGRCAPACARMGRPDGRKRDAGVDLHLAQVASSTAGKGRRAGGVGGARSGRMRPGGPGPADEEGTRGAQAAAAAVAPSWSCRPTTPRRPTDVPDRRPCPRRRRLYSTFVDAARRRLRTIASTDWFADFGYALVVGWAIVPRPAPDLQPRSPPLLVDYASQAQRARAASASVAGPAAGLTFTLQIPIATLTPSTSSGLARSPPR